VRALEGLGKSVFWDRDIAVGMDFQVALEKELEECSCIVVVWSRNSVQSEWVRAEAQNGLTRHILVPVQLDFEPLPIIFRHLETSQLQGFPGEHDAVAMTKLRNSINRVLGFDAVAETQLTEPIRDDPTLSVRLARRVLDAMNDSDKVATETCLRLQRIVSGYLARYVAGADWRDLREEYVSSIAAELNAAWLIADPEEESVLAADARISEPQEILKFLRQFRSAGAIDGPLVIDRNDPDASDMLFARGAFWILALSLNDSPVICFIGHEGKTNPVKMVQDELASITRTMQTVELASRKQ
jgi:hypothetical protein